MKNASVSERQCGFLEIASLALRLMCVTVKALKRK